MPEKIDPTWLAFALEAGQDDELVHAGLERVRGHYQEQVDYPLGAELARAHGTGLAVWADAEPRCQWPHFTRWGELTLATAYVPTGWERLIGPSSAEDAAPALAGAIRDEPGRAVEELTAPVVAGVLDERSGELIVINDAIGAGRCYELAFPGGTAWSNRLGALPLFAGMTASADERAWKVLAAATWFLGDALPISGARRVSPGTVIRASHDGVTREKTSALGKLVGGARLEIEEAAELAAEQAREQTTTAGALWSRRAEVDLSGGKDSRVVAAAVVASGIEARFHTSDKTPGEADVAIDLIAAAPGTHEHQIRHQGEEQGTSPSDPLMERAMRLHLLHDGMRHPQKLRGNTRLPRSRPAGATLSGHGGEIAQGFFYKTERQLKKLRRGGEDAIAERVMRFFTKQHGAARDEAYEAAEAEVRRLLEQGREVGVEGPELLDYFYLLDRFANRSGLASHAERISIFATPGFVKASFSLTPEQRIDARLHREVIARLVPAWNQIPYFKAPRRADRTTRRKRMWENAPDVEAFEQVLEREDSWRQLFDPQAVRGAWRSALAGDPDVVWESVFEGIVYRASFDDYLRLINERASVGPSLCV